jgi:hypothetical protein
MMLVEATAREYVEFLKGVAGEYIDLLTAKTEVEFDDAFDVLLQRQVARLEQNSQNLVSLGEVPLSAVLAGYLSIPGISVTQEQHSNGHVDITVEARTRGGIRRKLGEAKIYNGFIYHCDGLKQLLDRYTTGRECRGLLIVYVKKANIAGLVKELREGMDKDLPEAQTGPTKDHDVRWWFLSEHMHSSGENVIVEHVGCNMYSATKAAKSSGNSK